MIKHTQQELRGCLLIELERQDNTRKNFSLRGLAKRSGISHSLLSLLVSGKRPITQKSWDKLAKALPALIQPLQNEGGPEFEQLSVDDFSAISNWYYYAILSLMETHDFRMDYQWIAERLGITQLQARTAGERLRTMKLVAEKNGRWQQIKGPLKIENKKPVPACRTQQLQLLEKAIESLEQDPFEIRDFSSMTLAIDPKDIPYARERIKTFRRSLTQDLERRGDPKEVYHLTVQIYPVSKSIVERKSNL